MRRSIVTVLQRQISWRSRYAFCTEQKQEQASQQTPEEREEIFKKHIKMLEDAAKSREEKLKHLEEINKDHTHKIKELREVLKAELEEQELQQKRATKEKEQLKTFAISTFAKELLEVQDNLERALEATKDQNKIDVANLVEGVLMTHNILEKVFVKFEVKKIDCIGRKFDPNFHESLFQTQDPEKEPGSICYVAQDGYVIGERVLRPAKVGVVKQ